MSETPKQRSTGDPKALEIEPVLTACLFASIATETLDWAAAHARDVTEGSHALVVEAFLRYMQAHGCFDTSDETTG